MKPKWSFLIVKLKRDHRKIWMNLFTHWGWMKQDANSLPYKQRLPDRHGLLDEQRLIDKREEGD